MNAAKSPITKAHSTAMVVDDDAFSLAVAQRALRNLGFTECCLATDGQEGLRILAGLDRAPDLILCDIFMPNKDGFEFLTELAKRRYAGKVVLISGGDSFMLDVAEQLATADGLQVSAKITKPLDQHQLAEALGLS
jgi:CheY-like chemotaxis protein